MSFANVLEWNREAFLVRDCFILFSTVSSRIIHLLADDRILLGSMLNNLLLCGYTTHLLTGLLAVITS